MQFDFRQVYASAMQQWLGSSVTNTTDVLFNEFDPLELIGESVILGVEEQLASNGMSVYPNPISDRATIQFISSGEQISIDVFDIYGKQKAQLFAGIKQRGKQQLEWQVNGISPGKYLVVITSASGKKVVPVLKR